MGALTSRTDLVLFDARDALAVALRLAFGRPRPDDARADWSLVFDAASREMLAALAWNRSGLFIRRHADQEVSATWRRAAMAAHVRGDRQLALLRQAADALALADVDAVVLKGLPLGERLYGDPFVRCSSDIDLYVPAHQRERAAMALGRIGWRSIDGAAPWHESWSIDLRGVDYHLELHSSLVSDHLAHLGAPAPASAPVEIRETILRVHVGDFVAPYLAAHLATHQLPPLLWLVDFASLWSGMAEPARVRATEAARAAGLSHYLSWACERAGLVERIAAGDWNALGTLGVDSARRHDTHSIWRHLALAASNTDRLRLLAAFLVPRKARGSVHAIAKFTLARLRTRLGSLLGVSRSYGPSQPQGKAGASTADDSAPRPLRLDRDDLVGLTRDVVGAGGALRIRAPGSSMLPTIPRGALVRVGPVPTDGVSPGDIVLALTMDGEPVLHRTLSVKKNTLVMRGDAAITTDPPIPIERVIGVATHVRESGVDRPLGRRPRRSISISALRVRRRLAGMVRRAR